MRKIFRFRNLLIVAAIGGVVAVVVSRRSAVAPQAYPDPWVAPTTPATTSTATTGAEAAEAFTSNGVASAATDSESADS